MYTKTHLHIAQVFLAGFFLIFTASASLAWTISGTIYGGSDPLPDAVVTAYNSSDGSEVAASTTDGTGNYSLTVEDGTYNLLIEPPLASGYANSPVSGVAVSGTDVIQNAILVQQAVNFTGVLRLPDGSPIQGVTITVREQESQTEVGEMTTGADGAYQFPLAGGVYSLDMYGGRAYGANFVGAPYFFQFEKILIDLSITENKVQDITVPFIFISGQTTDSNGVPVGNVELQTHEYWSDNSQSPYAFYQIRHDNGYTKSDADGNYTMAVLPHDYDVTLIPQEGTGLAQTVVTNVSVTENMTKNFALEPAINFSGVLRLPDGSPIQGVTITVREQESQTEVGEMTTGVDGAYQFPLAGGVYSIDMYGGRAYGANFVGAPYFFQFEKILIDLSITEDKVQDITVPFIFISGQTTDSNGVPVGNVELQTHEYWSDNSQSPYAFYQIRHDNGYTKSDADGNYTMAVLPHDYDVTLIPQEGTGLAQTVVTNVSVTENMTKNFALEPAINFSGVLRLPDGSPIQGVTITVREQESQTEVGEMTTGVDGAYQFPLAGGVYSIDMYGGRAYGANFVGAPYFFQFEKILIDLSITEDKVQDITVPFIFISGQTTDSNGVPVGNVELQTHEYWSDNSQSPYAFYQIRHDNGYTKSDADGNYTMAVLPHDYDVTIIPQEGSGFAQTVVTGLHITESILQNVILSMPDDVAPIILSGPIITSVTDTAAVIEWQTDEKTAGEVRYGLSNPPTTVINETTFVTAHSQVLTGLTPDTEYFIQVTGSDASDNGPVVSTVVSFQTKPVPDIRAPVLTEGPIITSINHDTALVQWKTDEPSVGTLNHGLTEGFGGIEISALAINHQVTLTGLNAETLYYLQVSSVDGIGNGPSLSPIVSFSTVTAPDMTAPVIVEGPMILDISDTGATVYWTTDEPATSGVSYHDGTAYGVYQDDALVTEHTVKLTGLTASTLYEVTISSKDGLDNGPTLDGPRSFTTLAAPDTYAPVIIESPLIVNITHQSVVIRWRTNEPANGIIEYGLAADQLTESVSHAALKEPHNMTITGLEAGTDYFFRVLSTDVEGNGPAVSDVYSFTTDAAPSNKQPQLTKQPEVVHKDDDQITIAWETDEPTDTVVEYTCKSNCDNNDIKRQSRAQKQQQHQVTLVGLKPESAYSISILSTDDDGNTLIADIGKQPIHLADITDSGFEFPTDVTTDASPDDTNPLIVDVPEVIGTSNTTVTIRWVTDEIADSLVSYGLQGQSLSFQAGNITDVTEHIIVLTNLTPNTNYDFQVGSTDSNGNGPVLSQVLTFTTGTDPDTYDPVISAITVPVPLISEDGAVIEWTTDEAASTSIIYGTDSGDLSSQAAITGMRLDHSLVLTSLSSGTTYYFMAVSSDVRANTSRSSVLQFTTTGTSTADSDGDGVLDVNDAFPSDPTESVDSDSDSIGDNSDNCINIANFDQIDLNNNGVGDACEDLVAPVVTVLPVGGIFSEPVTVSVTATDQQDSDPQIYVAINSGDAVLYSDPIFVSDEAEIVVYAEDGSGNRSNLITESYEVDSLPPVLSVSALANNSITNSATINIAGVATDNKEIDSLIINTEDVSLDIDGSFSIALTLVEGENTITITATDQVGHSTEDIRTIILDSTLPDLTIELPADNSKTAGGIMEVSGTASENVVVEVTVNDQDPILANMEESNFSALVSLTPGINTITLTVTDLAGNSLSKKRTVTFDDQKPSLTISSPAEDLTTFESSLHLRGAVDDNLFAVEVSIEFNGEIYTPGVIEGYFDQVLSFAEAKTYQINITAIDEVGNSISATRNIIYADQLRGDLNRDDVVDVTDALMALQIAIGQVQSAEEMLLYGDVAPLVNGHPSPDGTINVGDALVILKKVVGLISY